MICGEFNLKNEPRRELVKFLAKMTWVNKAVLEVNKPLKKAMTSGGGYVRGYVEEAVNMLIPSGSLGGESLIQVWGA